jgi:methyl-accepting chemotaxis protein
VDRLKDGLKGSAADRLLREKIDRFQKSMLALEEQVRYLHVSSTIETKSMVSDIGSRAARTENVVLGTLGLAQNIHSTSQQIDSRVSQVETGVQDLQASLESQRDMTYRLNKQLEASHQATQRLSSVLQGVIQYAECT